MAFPSQNYGLIDRADEERIRENTREYLDFLDDSVSDHL